MLVATRKMTEEAFLRLPDNGRKYELVCGEPKEVPAGFRHDVYGANLIQLLGPAARGKGFLAGSQAGFRMQNGNIRCPDVSFTRKDRLSDGTPNEGFGDFAPDLCVEVISPSEDQDEMMEKVAEYFAAGARLVWHLFPTTRTVHVYTSPTDFTRYTAEQEIDGGDVLPTFRCEVAELFTLE